MMKLEINANSPESLRLAYRFWIELGRPAQFHNRKTLETWSVQIDGLYRESGLGFEDFKWFLIWALRPDDPNGARLGNDFTAKNLRMAKDPMGSLVKQFNVAFTIFEEKAEKIVPLLRAKRNEEEAMVPCELCSKPALSGKSICNSCAQNRSQRCEKCQRDGTSLCSLCMDRSHREDILNDLMWARFEDEHDYRRPGESVDEWIERHFAPIRDELRCPHCGYENFYTEEKRTAWCADCAEERQMYADEDREWMCWETPSVSCLTNEWEPSTVTPDTKARSALLRHAAEMYNQWLAAPVDGSQIVTSDLDWAQHDDLAAIIWLAALNRDGKARMHFPSAKSPAPRFTSFAAYREAAHGRVVEQHQLELAGNRTS